MASDEERARQQEILFRIRKEIDPCVRHPVDDVVLSIATRAMTEWATAEHKRLEERIAELEQILTARPDNLVQMLSRKLTELGEAERELEQLREANTLMQETIRTLNMECKTLREDLAALSPQEKASNVEIDDSPRITVNSLRVMAIEAEFCNPELAKACSMVASEFERALVDAEEKAEGK